MDINELINDGIIRTADVVESKFSKKKYYNFLKSKNYESIARGVYASKDVMNDPLMLIHSRCPQAVISHDEALYHYGLIDREPATPTFTIYSGYNAGKLKAVGYKAFYVKKEYLNIGVNTVTDSFGNEVPMYDIDRTLCDMIRNRSSFEIQDFNSALKAYVRRKDKNLSQLYDYAKLFRIEKIVRSYMEVLL